MARRRRAKPEQQQATGRKWVKASIVRPGEPDEELLDEEEILVQQFETEPAYIRVGAGVTKKIAEYESLRVDIAATVPCYREQIQDQTDAVAEWVADRLDEEVDEYLGIESEPEEDEDEQGKHFRIWSNGPDGIDNGGLGDDVTNWDQSRLSEESKDLPKTLEGTRGE